MGDPDGCVSRQIHSVPHTVLQRGSDTTFSPILFAGRAIYILQQTLPDFFSTGLVSSLETPVLDPARDAPRDDDAESIYSPRIRLMYTPVAPLPAPFPRTLQIEGMPGPLWVLSCAIRR